MRTPTVAVLLLVGCSDPALDAGGLVPDFSLEDVNESSPTARAAISPRDSIGMRSAWYFGHAT